MSDTILSVENLRKVYGASLFKRGGVAALDGVSLEVGRGVVFGLLGPNGAGKTTLVKVLLDLVRSYEGRASLFGKHPRDAGSRRRVGYLPEAHRLPGHLTGRQMLRLFGGLAGHQKADVEKRIGPLLERVDMQAAADRKVREYSKGMQQRIGLAQALINDPELVFLDEPTDGVDPVGRAAIRELVADLKRRGVTLFINSHLLMEVEMICDRAVIMDKGKIVRSGTMAELTRGSGRVRFELGTQADAALILRGLGAGLEAVEQGFELTLQDGETDQVIDRLRASSISIRAVTPVRRTLEEAFIDVVQKEKGAR